MINSNNILFISVIIILILLFFLMKNNNVTENYNTAASALQMTARGPQDYYLIGDSGFPFSSYVFADPTNYRYRDRSKAMVDQYFKCSPLNFDYYKVPTKMKNIKKTAKEDIVYPLENIKNVSNHNTLIGSDINKDVDLSYLQLAGDFPKKDKDQNFDMLSRTTVKPSPLTRSDVQDHIQGSISGNILKSVPQRVTGSNSNVHQIKKPNLSNEISEALGIKVENDMVKYINNKCSMPLSKNKSSKDTGFIKDNYLLTYNPNNMGEEGERLVQLYNNGLYRSCWPNTKSKYKSDYIQDNF